MSVLEHIDLFQGLAKEDMAALQEVAVPRVFPRNNVIINEGDFADSLFVIESGRVKVYCSDRNGKEFIMNTLETGDYFGELALLDDDRRSASVRTLDKSTFLVIYKQDFQQILDNNPGISKTLIANLARRVRNLTKNVKSLALEDVYGRVAKLLESLAEPHGEEEQMIPEKLTQQDIADRVGASREMVARILKDLTIGEYIRQDNRMIVLQKKLPASY